MEQEIIETSMEELIYRQTIAQEKIALDLDKLIKMIEGLHKVLDVVGPLLPMILGKK